MDHHSALRSIVSAYRDQSSILWLLENVESAIQSSRLSQFLLSSILSSEFALSAGAFYLFERHSNDPFAPVPDLNSTGGTVCLTVTAWLPDVDEELT